ncbi:hypothetical protein PR048_022345 [Dryococelus australis]|uniref:Uncharacterized protein n=1 Tax=Dryococelus australis TaxID=614101 RepID=A0ABQ9H0T9_9NEOP|nr:hypothetical protein PR048_022345 [Dryococelus australis]
MWTSLLHEQKESRWRRSLVAGKTIARVEPIENREVIEEAGRRMNLNILSVLFLERGERVVFIVIPAKALDERPARSHHQTIKANNQATSHDFTARCEKLREISPSQASKLGRYLNNAHDIEQCSTASGVFCHRSIGPGRRLEISRNNPYQIPSQCRLFGCQLIPKPPSEHSQHQPLVLLHQLTSPPPHPGGAGRGVYRTWGEGAKNQYVERPWTGDPRIIFPTPIFPRKISAPHPNMRLRLSCTKWNFKREGMFWYIFICFCISVTRASKLRALKMAWQIPEGMRGRHISNSLRTAVHGLVRYLISSFPLKVCHYVGGPTQYY